MPAPAQTLYCDAASLGERVGELALNLRADDDPQAVADSMAEGSARVDLFLRAKHPAADLAAIPWVWYCARAFIIHCLCRRRLNAVPEEVEKEAKEYEALCRELAVGTLTLLDLPRAPGGVAVSNQHVRLGLGPYALAVERARSTSPTAPTRRRYDRAADRFPPPFDGG